jgi:hypothetical protein
MCIKEFLGGNSSWFCRRVQIFASDLSEPAVFKAELAFTQNRK